VLCLQETLITSPSHLRINGFNQLNLYASSSNIRGISTLINCDYSYAPLDCSAFLHTSVEIIGTQIDCSLDEPLIIFNIYRHPNTNTPPYFYNKLFAFTSTHKYVLFLGDFNAHHSDWEDSHTDLQGERISQTSEGYNLVIMNDGRPTFQSSPNFSTSIIDLTFASRPLAPLINLETSLDLHGSDHYPIKISIRDTHPSVYRFSHKHHLSPPQLSFIQNHLTLRAPSLKEELSSSMFSNPIQKYEYFCKVLYDSILLVSNPKKSLPHKKRVVKTRILAPWWNDKCARAVELRSTMCRIYKAHPSWDNWISYKRSNAQCQQILRREKKAGWRNLCASFNYKTPMSEIWRFIKSYKTKSLTSDPTNPNSDSLHTAHETAFSKLCPPSCSHLSYPPLADILREDSLSSSTNTWLDDPFTSQELDGTIAISRLNSSPGLDQFDNRFIAALPPDIRSILLSIYNELYCDGEFPSTWSDSLVILVPKPGGVGHRPIALMSCFLKILERMIYRRLMWFVETQFLLPEFQAGFRYSRSCIDNIVTLTNRAHEGFLKKSSTITIFLNIAGAFDNVIPKILLDDLREIGLPARLYKFVENLLSERRIYSVINGTLQPPLTSRKGTPQGSILSPILFNIYLRKISSSLHPDSQIL